MFIGLTFRKNHFMQFQGNTDRSSAQYWNDLADLYQRETRISTDDFHYGPLLPGESTLGLLPPVSRRRCLEIGCGAGQNSIFLAKQDADCIALDISEEMLTHGRKLAEQQQVDVDFRCLSMDALHEFFPPRPAGTEKRGEDTASTKDTTGGLFDLIHSTYALPFSGDPEKVIADAAALLKPGGTFLLTVAHPLHSGEWLDIGDGEEGLFIPDCFHPEPDVRMSVDDQTMNAAQYWPISQVAEWIHRAGLLIERLLEPPPMPIPEMSEADILKQVPYDSPGWRELYPQIARIPVVVIFKCRKA